MTTRTFGNMLNSKGVSSVPFKSKAQERFMFAKHPDIAKRWAKETPKKKTPWHKMAKKEKA